MILRLAFHDEALSQQLEEKGYAVFNCLSSEEVESLKKMFYDFHADTPEGFFASAHLADAELRQTVSDKIAEILLPKVQPHFKNLNLLGGSFISKSPGAKGKLPLHQDWNIVDEKLSRSYNLWVPLVDVEQKNGAMRILEGSHEKHQTYRGPNLPPVLYQISEEVDQHMVPLEMKAGDALVYDHALWHSSPINQTEDLRLAAVFGAVPEKADLRFYYANGDQIEEYECNQEFLLTNNPSEGPKGLELLKTFDFKQKQLSQEDFDKVYRGIEAPVKTKRSFWSFLGSSSNS